MKTSKLFEASINVQAGTIAHYERIYFIDKDSLKFFSSTEKANLVETREDVEDFNNIKASLEELKVTVNENIYHARQAPPIDPEIFMQQILQYCRGNRLAQR